MILNVLSIAGSDPSGGAGIQADLKTFSALGVYGMGVITALTAQNTHGVTDVQELSAHFVLAQMEAIFKDIRVDAIKIGMIGSPAVADAIIDLILRYKPLNVVLDPVMVAQSGDRLISDDGVRALQRMLPIADVVTPNIPEAEMLLGREFEGEMDDFGRRLLKAGARAVFLKGGHGDGPTSDDLFMDNLYKQVFSAPRIKTINNHGTGCTLSSAIAAYLAKGLPVSHACEAGKKYVTEALLMADKLSVGGGHGPVHHFFAHWK